MKFDIYIREADLEAKSAILDLEKDRAIKVKTYLLFSWNSWHKFCNGDFFRIAGIAEEIFATMIYLGTAWKVKSKTAQ